MYKCNHLHPTSLTVFWHYKQQIMLTFQDVDMREICRLHPTWFVICLWKKWQLWGCQCGKRKI